MNKLWVFGDSFSYGTGINFELEDKVIVDHTDYTKDEWKNLDPNIKEEYYSKYFPKDIKFKPIRLNNTHKTWGQLLAKHYNYELVNMALPGYTHEQILTTIIDALSLIQENDKVVIGTTRGTRVWVPTGGFVRNGNRFSSSCALDVAFEYEKENRLTGFYDFNAFSKEEYMSLVDYRHKVMMPRQEDYEEYWGVLFDRLLEYLKIKKVVGLRWKSSIWDKYESFKQSEYKIDDGHWSPKGNYDFYKWVVYMLDSKSKLSNIFKNE